MARRVDDEEDGDQGPVTFAGGIVGRVVDRAMANPAATGGLLVMALTASAIVVNATLLQSGGHGRPTAARSASHAPASTAAVPTPRTRDKAGSESSQAVSASNAVAAAGATGKSSPAPAAAVAKPVTAPMPPAVQTAADPKLIADVQRELQRLGLYGGTIDGILGKRTQASIAAYQKAVGLTANGVPTTDRLALLRKPPAQPSPSPAASNARSGPLPPALIPVTASISPTPAKVAAAAASPPTVQGDAAAATYRRVQLALNQAGYGPIPVDGMASKETADAIRRFELDYAMPVTGQPNDAVLKRLVTIGALAAR